jgi:predicted ATPase
MLTLIEAYNFRCLRYIRQPLGPVHILVGPNASGRTTFLDVVTFLDDLVSKGLDAALRERSQDLRDLLWQHQGTGFELAVEAKIPEGLRSGASHGQGGHETVRYEVGIGFDEATSQAEILEERVLLQPVEKQELQTRLVFPNPSLPLQKGILKPKARHGTHTVVTKVRGNDNFYPEVSKEKRWALSYKLGARRSALGGMPADEAKFPVTTWFRDLLTEGVQPLVLNSLLIRRASPPGQGRAFRPDGSNLPWVIEELRQAAPERFQAWIAHLRTALPDLAGIRTVEREDDRHRYMILQYGSPQGLLEVPSWVASDGTLRLLALTLPAYLPNVLGIYLIEEPENGVHPKAVETLFQSLSSIYDAQVLMATHSPVILSLARPEQVLCFAKNEEGATDIVSGDQHPRLRDWRGEVDLGTLLVAGVLG